MSKRFLLVFGIMLAIFAGILLFKNDANAPTTGGQLTNHTYGEGQSGVTLMEYGDFQCPACYAYFPLVSEVKEKYKDQITFQFRHFPLVSAHRNAMAAHRAAEAASRQDKFWEMHDLLYANQKSWQDSNNAAQVFEGYATQIGLDIDKYKQDVTDASTAANVQADFKEGQDVGVQGTPTFFIDGKKYEAEDLRTIEDFSRLIDEAIKQKSSS